jgi:hypothetical protein
MEESISDGESKKDGKLSAYLNKLNELGDK